MGIIGHRSQPKQSVKHTEESIQRALWYHKPILSKPRYEMLGFLAYSWESDYLVISNAGYVYECEIKVSHADFLNEFKHKKKKMQLLAGEISTKAEFHDYNAHWKNPNREKPMQKPNYFYYVCPEGVIKPEELPPFAGLIYISDSGHFNSVRVPAPKLHNQKHTFTDEYLRDKCYWAMWNWVRRYWSKKVENISANTRAAYERALDAQNEKIADLEQQLNKQ